MLHKQFLMWEWQRGLSFWRKTFNKTPLKISVLICFGCYGRAEGGHG
jgi:hypothetical protein